MPLRTSGHFPSNPAERPALPRSDASCSKRRGVGQAAFALTDTPTFVLTQPGVTAQALLHKAAWGPVRSVDQRAPFDAASAASCRQGQQMRPARTPDLALSLDDVDLLRAGLGQMGPSVPFMFNMDGATLHLWRGSDGAEIYRARLQVGDDQAGVTALLVEHDQSSPAGLELEPAPFTNALTALLWTARQLRDGKAPPGHPDSQ